MSNQEFELPLKIRRGGYAGPTFLPEAALWLHKSLWPHPFLPLPVPAGGELGGGGAGRSSIDRNWSNGFSAQCELLLSKGNGGLLMGFKH